MKRLALVTKWTSIPVLLIASVFSQYAGKYESAIEILCCLGALSLAIWAVRHGEYLWAGGLAMVAIVFSPLNLVAKVFTLMAYMAAGTLVSLWAALRAGNGSPHEDVDFLVHSMARTSDPEEETCHLESISSGF